jgi:hypothetical protein
MNSYKEGSFIDKNLPSPIAMIYVLIILLSSIDKSLLRRPLQADGVIRQTE